MGLDEDEEYLHKQEVESPFAARSTTVRANRLEQGEVAWAREKRLKEIQMWSIVREFFAYLDFPFVAIPAGVLERQRQCFLPGATLSLCLSQQSTDRRRLHQGKGISVSEG